MGKIIVQCLEFIELRKTKHPFKLAIFSGVATCRFRKYSLYTVYKFKHQIYCEMVLCLFLRGGICVFLWYVDCMLAQRIMCLLKCCKLSFIHEQDFFARWKSCQRKYFSTWTSSQKSSGLIFVNSMKTVSSE